MISPVKIWRNQKKVATLIGKQGKIISWTMIYVPQGAFSDQAPYPVALIELRDKTRHVGQLVDWENSDIGIGKKVVSVLRRIATPDSDGVIQYGIKYKPVS